MNNDSTQAVLEPRTRHLLDQRLEPRILGVGTALPAHRIAQPDVRTLVRALFAGQYRDIDRLVNIFENSQIRTRHLCEPLEWFQQERPFAEKNALYTKHALELGERAARAALENAGLGPRDVDAIVFVSTTGIATPSLDSLLIKRLDLSRHVTRTPVWGLGCAGGAAGLARALEGARARPGSRVLLVAVELCSLTFQHGDRSKSNLVATSLFADGAAAVIVGPAPSAGAGAGGAGGPRLVGSYSTLWDDTEDVMGWDVVEHGLKVRFAKSVPDIVRDLMRGNLTEAAGACGLELSDLRHFVTHPGGLKVLQAYAEALGIEAEALADSYAVLEACGNMSSVSVLFVLERFVERWRSLPPGEFGAISAMGPGFSAEHVIFET